MLCIIGHILYMNAEDNSQQGSNQNSAALLKQALCNIPSPVSEIVIRNISSKVAQAYIEKVFFCYKYISSSIYMFSKQYNVYLLHPNCVNIVLVECFPVCGQSVRLLCYLVSL